MVLDHAMQQIQRPRVLTRCRPSAMLLLIVLVPLGLQNLLGITFENVSLGRFVSQLLCTTSSYPAQQHGGGRVTSVIESENNQQESNRADIHVSLYCFMVCHPIEANLLRAHLELGTLHGCDAFDVFSNTTHFKQSLPDGFAMISAVEGLFDVEKGGPFHTSLNSHIFQQVWRAVFFLGRYRSFDWIIKIDPDTLFFADSLRTRLEGLRPRVHGQHAEVVMLNANDNVDVHGPLIVLSKAAVDAYAANPALCEGEVDVTEKSEDWYLHNCMKLLGVAERPGPWLLKEWYGDAGDALEQHCTDPNLPSALHPIKSPESLRDCWYWRERIRDAQLMDFLPIPGPILSRDGKHMDGWSHPSSLLMVNDGAPLARLRRGEILVSMMLPTTSDRERFFKGALSSFLGQNYPNVELVVLSSAKSTEHDHAPIMFWEQAARLHPSIKYSHRVLTAADEYTLGVKRNEILKICEGEIIVAFDDDDYYHPEYVGNMAEQLLIHEADLVNLGRFDVLFARKIARDGVHRQGVFLEANFIGCGDTDSLFGYGFSYVFKRMSGMQYMPVDFQEDISFAKQIASAGGRVVSLHNQPLSGIVVKSQHGNQLSNVFCLDDSSMSEHTQKAIGNHFGVDIILSTPSIRYDSMCTYQYNVDTAEKRNLEVIEFRNGNKHLCCALCAADDRCGGFTFFSLGNYSQGCALKVPDYMVDTEQPSPNVILGIANIKTGLYSAGQRKHDEHDFL